MKTAQLISLIDLTLLSDVITEQDIQTLCQKAITPVGNVAAICTFSEQLVFVKKCLTEKLPLAVVINFPSGNGSLSTLTNEIKFAIDAGADELDIVFPYPLYLSGKASRALFLFEQIKLLSGNKVLKVILETGAFTDLALLQKMANDIVKFKPDFLKTSTGKIPVGATLPAVDILLDCIKGASVGLKISGGIKTREIAEAYLDLIAEKMGADFITAKHCRIGASGLIDTLIKT